MSRLYLGRLSDSARERDVERFFKGYGRIREIVLKNGYGFVVSSLKLCRDYVVLFHVADF
jgi:RNA recognition motif-containing protein